MHRTELYPFIQLCGEAGAIMTANLLVPALDPFHCATLSKQIIENLLRKEIGFDGVVITDSLVMKGFLTNCPNIEEAAIRAFEAGSDMLILGGKQLLGEDGLELTISDTLSIYSHLVEAVYSGRISQERLDRSVSRILKLKEKHNLFNPQTINKELIKNKVNTPTHKKLAREIAYRALHNTEEDHSQSLDYSRMRVAVFAPKLTQYDINHTTLQNIGKETKSLFFENLNPSESEYTDAQKLVEWCEAIIVCSYNAWRNDQQIRFIESLSDKRKPVTIIVLRDTQDSEVLKQEADFIISTSSPDAYSIQSVVDVLTGVINVP